MNASPVEAGLWRPRRNVVQAPYWCPTCPPPLSVSSPKDILSARKNAMHAVTAAEPARESKESSSIKRKMGLRMLKYLMKKRTMGC